jgi:hypothetical protein
MPQDRNQPDGSTGPIYDDWRALAEKASREQDPKKLVEFVQRLCEEIDRYKHKGTEPAGPDGH